MINLFLGPPTHRTVPVSGPADIMWHHRGGPALARRPRVRAAD